LREGERAVFDAAAARAAAATVLRPTLVYGAGRDRTLTRIAQLARRWGRFALPRDACGLRQPVHVDDLAAAADACIDSVASHGRAYALPGAETLAYREMVARVLAALQPPVPLALLPASMFSAALLGMRALGWARFPAGMDLRAMLGVGMLCGIGFTMSLFIASLAYHDPLLYDEAVLGVLAASVIAAVLGYLWLRAVLPARRLHA
jgi:uncharacterized protein YbjT (DUF2867 family)